METKTTQTVGATVADDYRTSVVFHQHGIDFCCNGGLTLQEACAQKGLSEEKLLAELKQATATPNSPDTDYNRWELDRLADHIQQKHHKYVNEQTPILYQLLDKICEVHGERHPELHEIRAIFHQLSQEFAMHMKKEELMIFPTIKNMTKVVRGEKEYKKPAFGSIEHHINTMVSDHATEGERIDKISALSNHFTTPADGCNTYRSTLQLLHDFEDDLHIHIHLENNILFPKGIALERKLQEASA